MSNSLKFILLFSFFLSCQKGDSPAPGDIYVTVTALSNAGHYVAKLWKNEVSVTLFDTTKNTQANAVYVTDSDVYVVGNEYIQSKNLSIARLWLNGLPLDLTNGTSDADAKSVFVSGTDHYVVGFEVIATGQKVAKLWKNLADTNLSNGNSESAANAVYVSGADVYVAGYEKNSFSNLSEATIWKNGQATHLTTGTPDVNCTAKSVFVSGDDVYVAGCETMSSGHITAKLWKNGLVSNVGNSPQSSIANSVFVSGTDVYVAGLGRNGVNTNWAATYWKNNTAFTLTGDSTWYGFANSIFVSGNDVYVAGSDNGVSKYWKNGEPTVLNDGTKSDFGTCIFVK